MSRASAGMRSRHGDERGSGTVLMAGLAGALVTLALGALLVVQAVHASVRAARAADLAALAAAGGQAGGGAGGCSAGQQVAQRNGARVLECVTEGAAVTVLVEVDSGLPQAFGPARARSRAGPAEQARQPAESLPQPSEQHDGRPPGSGDRPS